MALNFRYPIPGICRLPMACIEMMMALNDKINKLGIFFSSPCVHVGGGYFVILKVLLNFDYRH